MHVCARGRRATGGRDVLGGQLRPTSTSAGHPRIFPPFLCMCDVLLDEPLLDTAAQRRERPVISRSQSRSVWFCVAMSRMHSCDVRPGTRLSDARLGA